MCAMQLDEILTPALVIDEGRMTRNIERMRRRMDDLRVGFRPHVKTSKSIDVSRRLMTTPRGPITVSTL
jgi:D-serine deaminase-like pyridoxal phosphate-dependent protein